MVRVTTPWSCYIIKLVDVFLLSVGDSDLYRGEIMERGRVTTKRRLTRLSVPLLAIALALLYLALPNVQPSTAEATSAVITFETAQPTGQADLWAAGQVLRQRLSAYPFPYNAQPALAVQGNQLVVSLPAGVEPSVVVAEASRVGQVEIVDGGTEFLSVGSTVRTGPRAIPDQSVYQAVLTSAAFEALEAKLTDKGRPSIKFTLTPAGDARLAAHTAELRGYYLCLVVDGQVVNCPILRTPLTDRQGVIELTGDATFDDARMLATLLSSGPLPAPLKRTDD